MCTDSNFWWNWVVNLTVAIGTLAVAFVALFGDWLRHKLSPPKLLLSLKNPLGESTPGTIHNDQGADQQTSGRYYHIKVSNLKRWSPATNVQVFITQIEIPGPDTELMVSWSGEVPIRWRHHEVFPDARTIGPSVDCDLCSVMMDHGVSIHPIIKPFSLTTTWNQAVTFVISLQARSNESDSAICRIKISWDGEWSDGEKEMASHLVVKQL
jgi:hypothetical protein